MHVQSIFLKKKPKHTYTVKKSMITTSEAGGVGMGKYIVGSCVLSLNWIWMFIIMVLHIYIEHNDEAWEYFLPTFYKGMALCVTLRFLSN